MKNTGIFLALLFVFAVQAAKAQVYDTLPVIVHVINNGEPVGTGTNLGQVQVYSQFDVLNEDYRMANADLVNTPAVFMPLAGDMGLNFAKALVDPNGNTLAEPGIDRVDRNAMGWTAGPYSNTYVDATIKPQTIWDPSQYFNIWVLNLGGGLFGYSTFPSNTGLSCMPTTPPDSLRDGVVIYYKTFGRTGNLIQYFNKGRTATFEVGRWLGLRHLSALNGCDDCISDTPPTELISTYCPSFPDISTTCNNAPNGNMFMNFMAQGTGDSCKSMFTLGQKARIDTTLINGTYQSALRLSNTANPSAIKEHTNTLAAAVYPNPAHGSVMVRLPASITCTVELYNIVGENILETIIANSMQTELQLGNLPCGVYMLKLQSDKGSCMKKLVISK